MSQSSEFSIAIDADGIALMIYSDEHADFLRTGKTTVRRVSNVEPAPQGGWTADMSPVDGPVLGPYPLRQQALDAEVEYLKQLLF